MTSKEPLYFRLWVTDHITIQKECLVPDLQNLLTWCYGYDAWWNCKEVITKICSPGEMIPEPIGLNPCSSDQHDTAILNIPAT